MIKKLIPVFAIIIAAIGGLVGGEMLRPGADEPAESHVEGNGEGGEAAAKTDAGAASSEHGEKSAKSGGGEAKAAEMAYFRFPSQFFVPVMHGDRLDGMIILTLTIEMPADQQEAVFRQEFRLRDAFLRALLIHANTGGFDGNYTIEPRMRRLRDALMKVATEQSGGLVTDVLIEDIARQDSA